MTGSVGSDSAIAWVPWSPFNHQFGQRFSRGRSVRRVVRFPGQTAAETTPVCRCLLVPRGVSTGCGDCRVWRPGGGRWVSTSAATSRNLRFVVLRDRPQQQEGDVVVDIVSGHQDSHCGADLPVGVDRCLIDRHLKCGTVDDNRRLNRKCRRVPPKLCNAYEPPSCCWRTCSGSGGGGGTSLLGRASRAGGA